MTEPKSTIPVPANRALHLRDGHPVFSVRIARKLTAIEASEPQPEKSVAIEARLGMDGAMTMLIDGAIVATGMRWARSRASRRTA